MDTSSVPAAESSVAGVLWSSIWGRGGGVLFFSDATYCVRDALPIGAKVLTPTAAEGDPDGSLLRIDFQGAEVSALERGVDLNRSVVWILIGKAAAQQRQPAVERARELEGRLFALGLTRRVRIAGTDAVREGELRLLILGDGDVASLTDRLPAAVRGPPVAALPDDVELLLAGPGPMRQHVYDWVGVTVWIGDDRQGWPVPLEDYTATDKAWSEALARVSGALARGCVF